MNNYVWREDVFVVYHNTVEYGYLHHFGGPSKLCKYQYVAKIESVHEILMQISVFHCIM